MRDATAQQLGLTAAAVPGRAEMRVDGAPPGAGVAVVIGLQPGAGLLHGHVFGVEQPELAGIVFADGDGIAFVAVTFPVDSRRGLPFFAQAVAFDPQQPFTGAASVAVSPVCSATVPAVHAVADVVVLFGQSNAEGHADATSLPASLRGPMPRCRIWVDQAQSFAAMQHGVNTRIYGPPTWCGPELMLGQQLTASGNVVYVLKLAAPSTTLGPSPGAWSEWGARSGELYAVLRFRLAAACARLRADGLVPRVRGVCMMQGESDATTARLAQGYRQEFALLVATLEQDLAAERLLAPGESVPFVAGRISRGLPAASFPFVDLVRKAQTSVARSLPRARWVDTDDLTFAPDGLHFDAAAVRELGRRFAAALATLH